MNIQDHLYFPIICPYQQASISIQKMSMFPFLTEKCINIIMDLKNKNEQLCKFIFKAFCGQPEVCLLQHNVVIHKV